MLFVTRQARPEVTLAVCRGACRLMRQAGHSVLLEVPLPDGRRADIFAVGRSGEITIVEVKSSIEDWRVDIKWPDYLDWCDQLYVAVPIDFPQALIPEEIGLIRTGLQKVARKLPGLSRFAPSRAADAPPPA